jgi:hypothetical protein
MCELGICKTSGRFYEGTRNSGSPVVNHRPLMPIDFVGVGMKLRFLECDGLASIVFREDSFDPVTKIRRGRVYRLNDSQPVTWRVHDPARKDLEIAGWAYGAAQQLETTSYNIDALGFLRGHHPLPKVVLGKEPHQTFWKILSIETQFDGKPLLTLKALHSYGVIPELILSINNSEALIPLREALDKVEASANRLGPVDTIDRCRDALSIIFGDLAGDMRLDLGAGIKKRISANKETNPKSNDEDLVTMCGNIVARLHARGKPNERTKHDTRAITDADAQLALNCLWFVLVELGWATN